MTDKPLAPEEERSLRSIESWTSGVAMSRIWATLDAARARIAELEGTAQEVQSFAENYKRERDEARAEMRRWKIELAPELCGGTDYWDSHTPREVAAEALRLRNETIDAITGIQKREIARMRPVVEAARAWNNASSDDGDEARRLERAVDALDAAEGKPSNYASERDREMAESFCDAHGWVVLTEPFVGKVQLHFEDELAAAIAAARAEVKTARLEGWKAGVEAAARVCEGAGDPYFPRAIRTLSERGAEGE